MQFHTQEGTLDLPDGLQDNSVNMLMKGTSDLSFSFVITRDRLEAGETLDGFVERQLKTLTQKVSKCEVAERNRLTLGGGAQANAFEIALQFKQNGQQIYQRQLACLLKDQISVVAFSAGAVAPFSDAQKKQWQAIYTSFRERT